MKKKKNGFAATGILYTILIIFLVLMTTLLVTLASRSKVLEKLKKDAISGVAPYESLSIGEYKIGRIIPYLRDNWIVLESDNSTYVTLMYYRALTTNELRNNLSSSIPSSNILDKYGFGQARLCISGSSIGSNYCYYNGGTNWSAYTWEKSYIRETLDNWIKNKISENGKNIKDELFKVENSDNTSVATSYAYLPSKELVEKVGRYMKTEMATNDFWTLSVDTSGYAPATSVYYATYSSDKVDVTIQSDPMYQPHYIRPVIKAKLH